MIRLMLTDEHWSKLRNIMRECGIYDKPNLRKTVEGILYRMRTGLPWRHLPSAMTKQLNHCKLLLISPVKKSYFSDAFLDIIAV